VVGFVAISALCAWPPPIEARPSREALVAAIAREAAVSALGLRLGDRELPEHEAAVAEISRELAHSTRLGEGNLQAAGRATEERAERRRLIWHIARNVGMGLAVVFALLLLRAVIGRIGRAVAAGERRAGVVLHTNARLLVATWPAGVPADDLARSIVESRLAAFADIVPHARSIWPADSGSQIGDQAILAVRTTQKMEKQVTRRLQDAHPTGAEVVGLPIRHGLEGHLDQIAGTSGQRPWWRLLIRG